MILIVSVKKIELQKVADICYDNQHINRLKIMRFTNYIPTEMGESGRLDLPFFIDFDLTPDSLIRYGQYIQIVSVKISWKLIVWLVASYLHNITIYIISTK